MTFSMLPCTPGQYSFFKSNVHLGITTYTLQEIHLFKQLHSSLISALHSWKSACRISDQAFQADTAALCSRRVWFKQPNLLDATQEAGVKKKRKGIRTQFCREAFNSFN